MKQLIRSLSFFQQPHFQFASFTEKMQKSQEQKAKDQFKKEIDYLLNKPEFTMIDFRQRAVDGLAQIKKGFIKKLMVGASQEEQEKKLEIQKKIMNAMFDNELLEIDNITSEVKIQSIKFKKSKRNKLLWFHNLQFRMLIKLLKNMKIFKEFINGFVVQKVEESPYLKVKKNFYKAIGKINHIRKQQLKNIIVIFKIRNQERQLIKEIEIVKIKMGCQKEIMRKKFIIYLNILFFQLKMDYEDEVYQSKKILISQNGHLDCEILVYEYTYKTLLMSDIKQFAESKYKIQYEKVRLFTQQGVELYEEDLPYLKDGLLIYISNGCDFDSYSQFNIYQIIRTLGEGGFGKVLLGKHKLSGDMVAIKLIDCLKMWNAADIDMVFREAEVMKSLSHKNIVKIMNCYTLPNMQVVLIMEYLQGGELFQYVTERGRLTEDEARHIFKQIVEAINYCHNKRLIHRDLKLENILLTNKEDGQVKIIDFGIASVVSNFNIDKVDIGTLSYMAPEILNGQAKIIKSSIDIWALGCILYGMVCGSLPFNGGSQFNTISNILSFNFKFPTNIGLSAHLKDLISQMLSFDPNQRPFSYQILGHPWFVKTNNIKFSFSNQFLSPKNINMIRRETSKQGFGVSSKYLLTKDLTQNRNLIQKNQPQKSPGNNQQQVFFKDSSSQTQIQPQLVITAFNDDFSPMNQVKKLDTSQSRLEQSEQDLQPKNLSKRTDRSNDLLNNKIVDRIFRDDEKQEREKKKQELKLKKQLQFLNTPPKAHHIRSSTSPNILMSSKQSHHKSKESFITETKRVKKRQIQLKTIISLSQQQKLKQEYREEIQSQQLQRKNQNDKIRLDTMYQIQRNFQFRKKNSDQLFERTFQIPHDKQLSLKMVYSVFFPKKN